MQFDDVITTCIERLALGKSVESCLALFPEHAQELEPLLRAAASLHAQEKPTLSAAAFDRGRQAMRRSLAAHKDYALVPAPAERAMTLVEKPDIPKQFQSKEPEKRSFAWPTLAGTAVAACLLIVVLFGVSQTPQVLPGSSIYWAKELGERGQGYIMSTTGNEVEWRVRLANRRVAELQALQASGQAITPFTVQPLIDEIDSALAESSDLPANERARLNDEMRASLDLARRTLEITGPAVALIEQTEALLTSPDDGAAAVASVQQSPTPTLPVQSSEPAVAPLETPVATPGAQEPSGIDESANDAFEDEQTEDDEPTAVAGSAQTSAEADAMAAAAPEPAAIPIEIPTVAQAAAPTAAPTEAPTQEPPTPEATIAAVQPLPADTVGPTIEAPPTSPPTVQATVEPPTAMPQSVVTRTPTPTEEAPAEPTATWTPETIGPAPADAVEEEPTPTKAPALAVEPPPLASAAAEPETFDDGEPIRPAAEPSLQPTELRTRPTETDDADPLDSEDTLAEEADEGSDEGLSIAAAPVEPEEEANGAAIAAETENPIFLLLPTTTPVRRSAAALASMPTNTATITPTVKADSTPTLSIMDLLPTTTPTKRPTQTPATIAPTASATNQPSPQLTVTPTPDPMLLSTDTAVPAQAPLATPAVAPTDPIAAPPVDPPTDTPVPTDPPLPTSTPSPTATLSGTPPPADVEPTAAQVLPTATQASLLPTPTDAANPQQERPVLLPTATPDVQNNP